MLTTNYKETKNCVRMYAFYGIVFAVINFFGFLLLTINVNGIFIWFTVAAPLFTGVFLLSLRCPYCKTRI